MNGMTEKTLGQPALRLDFRNPDLWSGVSSTEMWERWKRRTELRVAAIFSADRPRAVANVRIPERRNGAEMG